MQTLMPGSCSANC